MMDPNLLEFPFDATQWEPYVGGAGRTYPAGTYLMAITDLAHQQVRNDPNSWMLRTEYTIYTEGYQDAKYVEFLNLWHASSEQARDIAMRQLSSICHAVGKLQIQNLSEVANLPMLVELDYEEAIQGGTDPSTGRDVKAQGARNRVNKRMPYDVQAAAAAQPHIPQQPPFMASGNAAAAAAAPPMGSPTQAQPQAAQRPQPQAARPNGQAGAAQTPPPFAQARPAQTAAPTAPPAAQQPIGAVPPWLQPK